MIPVNLKLIRESGVSFCKRCAVLATCLAAFSGISSPELAAQQSALPEELRHTIAFSDEEWIISNVRVVDGTGHKARESLDVHIKSGAIHAIGPSLEAAGIRLIEGNGKTLMPGFVMLHEHLFYPDPLADVQSYISEPLTMSLLYLAGGTTTIRTAGTMDAHHDIQVKRLIEQRKWPGPDVFVTAPFFEGPNSHIFQMVPLENAAGAKRYVDYWLEAGASSFKAYINVSREVLTAVIAQAHSRGAMVTGHLCSITFEEASALGIDNLEHGAITATDFVAGKKADQCPPRGQRPAAADIDPDKLHKLAQTLVDREVAITSTLPVFSAGLDPRIPSPQAFDALSTRTKGAVLDKWREVRRQETARKQSGTGEPTWLAHEQLFEKSFYDKGGRLLVGTDPTGWGGTIPPNSTHAALMLLADIGISPLEVIRLATLNGAEFLDQDTELGSIQPGKRANLVLVDGRPDETIEDIQNVSLVVKDGIAYDPAALLARAKGRLGR